MAKDKFYIDREFGQPIWVDVEDGIVLQCTCEKPKFLARMNELYVGKSITFLSEDFCGRAMKGTYHRVKPDTLTVQVRTAERHRMVVKQSYNELSLIDRKSYEVFKGKTNPERVNFVKSEQKRIRALISEQEKEQYKAERMLKTEKERILTEHNFKS